MVFLLRLIVDESSPLYMALGVVMGMFLALTPIVSLQAVVLWALVLVLRMNILSAAISFAAFWLFSFPLQSLFYSIGYYFLTRQAMIGFWSVLYHSPIVPFTQFNHTTVLGSFLFCASLSGPLFYVSYKIFRRYPPTFSALRAPILRQSQPSNRV